MMCAVREHGAPATDDVPSAVRALSSGGIMSVFGSLSDWITDNIDDNVFARLSAVIWVPVFALWQSS